jgi:putative transposase
MPNYRRVFVPGGCYFFTVNLLERKRTLLTDHIDLLRDSVRTVRRLYPFHIDAWVVLPDHMHCVLTLPPNERLSAVRKRRGERGIWQRRYWEHMIRDERDYARHVDYIHVNPLKHGCVKQVGDWPYSTFHRYVSDGSLPADWCGVPDDLPTALE